MNSTADGSRLSSKTAAEEYDLVILGSGAGSKLAAWTFAGKGQHVAVIERKYVGGSCPNIACLPSKNIIHTAQVASYVRRSGEFGISRDRFRVDMSAVRDRKRQMVSGLVEMHLDEYKRSGAEQNSSWVPDASSVQGRLKLPCPMEQPVNSAGPM
jgi:pyruvate/2-oxoglutarate dehydrogenase complex dihydrolipoamide dehydrogenase (E3) component